MHIWDHRIGRLGAARARTLAPLLGLSLLVGCADLQDMGEGQGGGYQPPPAPTPRAATGPEGYRLVFDDEFDSTAGIGNGRGNRPPSTPWWNFRHAILLPGENYVSASDRRAYSTSNGVLTMATYRNAQGKMTEADIETVRTFGPEFYAEVRMRGPQVGGTHDGVWFLSVENGRGDPTGGHTEFDLVEQYGPSDQGDHSTIHQWPGSRHDIQHKWKSYWSPRPEGKSMQWHTYGLAATRDAFVVSRDGGVIQRIPRSPGQVVPMYLLLSLFGNGPHAPPATMLVDYVRVYEPG